MNRVLSPDKLRIVRVCFFVILASSVGLSQEKVDFLKEVQPILTAKCLACHSGDAPQAGLKVHTRDDLMKGGATGPAIVPGQGEDSLLVAKMEGKKGMRMPPSGPPVDAAVIERIRLWIDQGAKFEGSTSISDRIAPLAPRTPAVPGGSAPNPVDRFIGAYFAAKSVKSPKLVSDALFARRAWMDITGLPPTPEELRDFEQSKATDKRERVIDTLLAKRQSYAEHWISFWNDSAS